MAQITLRFGSNLIRKRIISKEYLCRTRGERNRIVKLIKRNHPEDIVNVFCKTVTHWF